MSGSGDLQEIFKRAAEIAAVVPESMQEAAFHRALDALTGTDLAQAKKTAARRGAKKSSSRGGGGDAGSGQAEADRVAQVTAISKDDAPEVDRESTALGRSIALLVVADREAGVDGMTAPEIAQVLTEKFRHRTSRQSVQSALDAAGNMVDRHKPGSGAALYRVMKPGEAGEDGRGASRVRRVAPPRRRQEGRRLQGHGEGARPRQEVERHEEGSLVQSVQDGAEGGGGGPYRRGLLRGA
jgi:hypothetical protein